MVVFLAYNFFVLKHRVFFLRFVWFDFDLISMHSIRPRGFILFPCPTQLSLKNILLINVKMPKIVGILLFVGMINTSDFKQ